MNDFEGYRYAGIDDRCQEDITRLENTIKNRDNKDVILIAYEKEQL